MNPELKDYTLQDLKSTLRYQTLTDSHAVVTMGPCALFGCSNSARGSGVCRQCIEKEIEEREKK